MCIQLQNLSNSSNKQTRICKVSAQDFASCQGVVPCACAPPRPPTHTGVGKGVVEHISNTSIYAPKDQTPAAQHDGDCEKEGRKWVQIKHKQQKL